MGRIVGLIFFRALCGLRMVQFPHVIFAKCLLDLGLFLDFRSCLLSWLSLPAAGGWPRGSRCFCISAWVMAAFPYAWHRITLCDQFGNKRGGLIIGIGDRARP
jgi:hypothetical protein